jgi:hypothetical protein
MTVYLSQLGGSGAPAPAASILYNAVQGTLSATVTQSIPAGTYSVVSDFVCQLTINSINYLIPSSSTPTVITTTATVASFVVTNLSIATNITNKTLPVAIAAITYGNGVFVALPTASGASCYTSPDGITWTVRTLPSTNTWAAIAWNGTNFCALGSTSGTVAATSPDGTTWTARTMPATTTWSSIAWNGTNFAALGNTAASTVAASSPDGITWTSRTLPTSAQWSQVIAGGSLFLATSSNTAFATSSDNGLTWTARTGPGLSSGIYSVAYGNGIFLAFLSGTIYTSPDGITWTTRNTPWFGGGSVPTLGVPMFVNGQFVLGATQSNYATYSGNLNGLLLTPDGVNFVYKTINTPTNQVNSLFGLSGYALSPTVFYTLLPSGTNGIYSVLAPNRFGIYAPPALTI